LAARDLDPTFRARRILRDTILSAPRNSIVFLPQMPDQPFLMLNEEGLQTVPLVAIQYKGEWVGMTRLFPGHHYFRLDHKPEPRLSPLTSLPPFKVHRDSDTFDIEPVVTDRPGRTARKDNRVKSATQYRSSRPVWVPDGSFVANFYFDTKLMGSADTSSLVLEIRQPDSDHLYARKQVDLKNGQDRMELFFSVAEIGMVEVAIEHEPSTGTIFLGSSIEEIN
jgi:hypothetical protein